MPLDCVGIYRSEWDNCSQSGINLHHMYDAVQGCSLNMRHGGVMTNHRFELYAECSNGQFVLLKECGEPCGGDTQSDCCGECTCGGYGTAEGWGGNPPSNNPAHCPDYYPDWEGGYYQYHDGNDACASIVAGDTNEDGQVNVLDVTHLITTILSVSEEFGESSFSIADYPQYAHMDITGDGIINVLDVVTLIQMILSDRSTTAADREELNRQSRRLDGLDGRTKSRSKKMAIGGRANTNRRFSGRIQRSKKGNKR